MTNTPGRILIVEDDVDYAQICESQLQGEGYEVKTVSSAPLALISLNTFKPDLVILDIRMAGEDGFAALEAIKSDARWKILRVIILSNLSDVANRAKGFELGASDYLVKANTSLSKLKQTVKQILDRKVIAVGED